MMRNDYECSHGHRYTPENTQITPRGWRRCRTCNRIQQNRTRTKAKGEDLATKRVTTPVPVTILPRRVPEDADWRSYGMCAQTDPEAFFPDKGGATKAAKKLCGQCEVRDTCLQNALDNDERFGIWGGLTEQERKQLRRQLTA